MKSFFISLLLTITTTVVTASIQERSIALLDMSQRNSETNDSNLFSAEHILKVTGVLFKVTTSLQEASNYAIILCSSQINSNSFTDDEKVLLTEYVSNGGILITQRMLDSDLFSLFGISGFSNSRINHKIDWSDSLSAEFYDWIDEPSEKQISLGNEELDEVIKTYSYEITNATILGTYNNGTVAALKNNSGNGFTYSFGVSWKDVILRSQINRDYEAQRTSGNGFEPTQDVFMLFIRAIAKEHIPYLTWKHTSSGNSTSTLIITHDIDSSSGMDMLSLFADSEKETDIITDYNITVRYFSDALNSDFYNNRASTITDIINNGHTIGSHSVGHFPDFADNTIFPMGATGNTKANYTPYNDDNKTIGGNVFGECEVSKNILENDFPIEVRSFRSGHLAYNKYLVNVLDSLGYLYNSSNNANDVLTHFPYQNKMSRSFNGATSKVYELPVTISDVFKETPINEENYTDKVAIWLDVLKKTNNNGAPAVLLIHPNRNYKLTAQELLLSELPEGVYIEKMNAYGDYWKARENFNLITTITNNIAYVTVSKEDIALDKNISFIINNGQELDDVIVKDEDGNSIDFLSQNWKANDLMLFQKDIRRTYKTTTLGGSSFTNTDTSLEIYPNPVEDKMNIKIDLKYQSNLKIELTNIYGQVVFQSKPKNYTSGLQKITFSKNNFNVAPGIYLCTIKTERNGTFVKKIIMK